MSVGPGCQSSYTLTHVPVHDAGNDRGPATPQPGVVFRPLPQRHAAGPPGLGGPQRKSATGDGWVLLTYSPRSPRVSTKRNLVRLVLNLLGHDYEVHLALGTPDGTKRPDYVLYRSAAVVAANKNRSLNEEWLRGSAFAVDDAKY